MAKLFKKNSKLLIIIILLAIGLIAFYFLREAPVGRASEEIKIFPTNWVGAWKNPEAIFVQDLGEDAELDSFNSENSAYPQITQGETINHFSIEKKKIIEEIINQSGDSEAREEEKQPEESVPTLELEPEVLSQPEPETESLFEPEAPSAPENNSSEPELITWWQKIKNIFRIDRVFAREETTEEGKAVGLEEKKVEEDAENLVETQLKEGLPEEPDENIIQTEMEEDKNKNQYLVEDIFEVSNFLLADDFFSPETKIKNIQLRISMAGKGGEGDKLVIKYNWSADQDSWQILENFDLANDFSNATNGGYFLFGLPIVNDQEFFKNLKIRFTYLDIERPEELVENQVFVDAVWLEMDYEKTIEEELEVEESIIEEEIISDETEDLGGEKIEVIGKKIFLSNENPEFTFRKRNQALFETIFSFLSHQEVEATLFNSRNQEVSDGVTIENNKIKISKNDWTSFRPGLYKLIIKIKEGEEDLTEEINFAWGVIAVNVRRSYEHTNTQTEIGMSILDNYGRTQCNANVELDVIGPDKKVQHFATADGTIIIDPECVDRGVTNNPDYAATYTTQGPGRYLMKVTATIANDTRSITDYFIVKNDVPFDVERTIFPTRIYPMASYPVQFTITARKNYSGMVVETVPSLFELSAISDNGTQTQPNENQKQIIWQVDWKKGETYTLGYTIKFPMITPERYLLGPLQIGNFKEARQWQIASDDYPETGDFFIKTGYYVGRTTPLKIYLGFRPEMVIVKSSTTAIAAVFKTTAMLAPNVAYLSTATADNTAGMILFESDGFTVSSTLSSANVIFSYIAFTGSDCSASGVFCVGSYQGTGSAKSIVTGFQPDIVWAKSATNAVGATFRTSSMPDNVGQYFIATTQDTSGALFQTLNSDGFTVGATNSSSGVTYYYAAFKNVTGKVNVGTYTGNATDNRNITGVGFVPNWVFVKNANASTAVSAVYNVTECYGDSSYYFTATANLVDAIQALQTDGFQVGTNSTVNGSGNTIYWVAFGDQEADPAASGTFKMAKGSYTGTGERKVISGLGFSPDLVIIKGNTAQAGVFRTKMMAGDSTAYLDSATGNFAGGIISLNPDGFTIGTDVTVNSSSVTYYWEAFGDAWKPETRSGAADFFIGAYYGNGIDNRNINNLPFQPDLVTVKLSGATAGAFRTSLHSGDSSSYFTATADASNIIQTFNTDGFQIGTAANVNTAASVYWYFGFKTGTNLVINSYTGNGTSQNITTVGFQPDFLWIKASTAQYGVQRNSSASGDLALPFINTAGISNAITGLLSNGFSVGNAAQTNSNGVSYRYVAWRIAISGITISGTVYQTDESTPIGGTPAIKLAVGTSTSYSTTVNSGSFSFTGVASPTDGTIITIWLDTSGTTSASLVLKYGSSCTGYPDCTGLYLYQNRVNIDSKDGTSITNANLAACDNDSGGSVCGDTDIGFTSNDGVLNLTFSTNMLRITSGITFAPGGNVNCQKLRVAGTYSGGSETLTLSGSGTNSTCGHADQMPLCVDGNYTASNNTTKFTGNSASNIALNSNFYNLDISPAATVTYTLGTSTFQTLTIGGTFDIGDGTNTLTVTGATNNPTISVTGATTIKNNATLIVGTGTKTFGDINVNSGGTWDNSANANVTINGSITNNQTFIAGSGTYTLTGASKNLNGTLSFTEISVSGSYTNNGICSVSTSLAGAGSFTNGNGTSGTLNFEGSSITVSTFDASAANNTVNYNSTSQNQTVRAGTYDTLQINKTGQTAYLANTTTVNTVLTITAGTLNTDNQNLNANSINIQTNGTLTATNSTITLTGNSGSPLTVTGTFNANTSTVIFNGNANLTVAATTYYNLTFSPVLTNLVGNIIYTGDGATVINNSLTLNPSGSDSSLTYLLGGAITGPPDILISSSGSQARSILDTKLNSNFAITANSITLESGGTLNANNSNINVSSNWTNNNGVFNAGQSKITLNGSSRQRLFGIMIDTSRFYDLRITNTSSEGILFDSSCEVSGTFTDVAAGSTLIFAVNMFFNFANININGADENNITMTSDNLIPGQPGNQQWYFNVSQSSPTVSYVAVYDSNADGSNESIDATNNCYDGGNNSNWDFVVANTAPIVSNVQLNNQEDINFLLESTTVEVSATADVYDAQGCNTITNVTAKIYRSGVSGAENCLTNANNCYAVASCTETFCEGTNATYTCIIQMQYHADPTDANTPWTDQYWRAWVQASDGEFTHSAFSPANAPDVTSLLALDLDPNYNSIDYGELLPGNITDPLVSQIKVRATGNVSLDVYLYGTHMLSSGSSNIPVSNQRWGFGQTAPSWSSGTALTLSSSERRELNCCKTFTTGSPAWKPIWWGIEIPSPMPSGEYFGTNTIEAVKNQWNNPDDWCEL